uniref:Uncharacterized protein n=1 Tax=Timema cristinae TaxID=61476 RepID=A0A7R9DAN5_TIMCR|nr:unnamed protein product [Timema cristinae]
MMDHPIQPAANSDDVAGNTVFLVPIAIESRAARVLKSSAASYHISHVYRRIDTTRGHVFVRASSLAHCGRVAVYQLKWVSTHHACCQTSRNREVEGE